MKTKAVILISGGLDSTTVLAIAKSQGFECYALSFDYDQRHAIELNAAKKIATMLKVKQHRIVKLNIGEFGGSALTDRNIEVPNYRKSKEIPITYVPARNTIFLSIALGFAEVIGAYDIFYGANAMDYSGYPDCRPDFMRAFEKVAELGTKAGVEGKKFKIHAPLIEMSKAEIIKTGIKLGIDYSITISCYHPDEKGCACGRCDSCHYRRKGFREANVSDPTFYQ